MRPTNSREVKRSLIYGIPINELPIFLIETIKTQITPLPLNRLKNLEGSLIREKTGVVFPEISLR